MFGRTSAERTANFGRSSTAPSRPVLQRDDKAPDPAPVLAQSSLADVGEQETLALAIATRQLKHLDELAHIDYDLCLDDPDVRAVVAEALRWGALMELEAA